MGGLQESLAGKIGRRWAPGRNLAFVLLGFALIGYCGLPSNPPSGLDDFQTASHAQADDLAAPKKLLAPTQAKEHRTRDSLAEPETDQPDDRLPIALPRPGVEFTGPFRHAAGLGASRSATLPGLAHPYSSRAPPVPQVI